MNAIKEWWNQNTPRDQMALFVLGLAVVVYILYALVSGAHSAYENQLERNQRVNASLNEVRSLSAQLLAKSNSGGGGNSNQGNLTEQVNTSLRAHNLRLSSMQPQSNGAVRLRMEKVSYSKLIAWLHEIEAVQGVKIKDSTITTASQNGSVNVTVTLLK